MRQLVLKYVKYFIYFLFLAFAYPSCDKINESPIPDVYVSFTVDLHIANELTIPGTSVFFPQAGFGGVIIYCFDQGMWYAFDAACTLEASRNCIVKNESGLAECPCCGSQFVLPNSGYPVKAPATVPLKHYNVSLVNNYILRVFN